jgi:hypothetical protein
MKPSSRRRRLGEGDEGLRSEMKRYRVTRSVTERYEAFVSLLTTTDHPRGGVRLPGSAGVLAGFFSHWPAGTPALPGKKYSHRPPKVVSAGARQGRTGMPEEGSPACLEVPFSATHTDLGRMCSGRIYRIRARGAPAETARGPRGLREGIVTWAVSTAFGPRYLGADELLRWRGGEPSPPPRGPFRSPSPAAARSPRPSPHQRWGEGQADASATRSTPPRRPPGPPARS